MRAALIHEKATKYMGRDSLVAFSHVHITV
jgi:hypothetical protein